MSSLESISALAVLEPFLADLVAADVEVAHGLAHALEAGCLRLVHPHGVLRTKLEKPPPDSVAAARGLTV